MGELDERVVAWQEWETVIRLVKENSFAFVKQPTFAYECTGDLYNL
jgi:hypothetical protein